MISCMISYIKNHDIIYDIMGLAFLARTISYQKLWYCVWYHILCIDIMYDITKTIIKSLSCAIFMADIIYISYVIAYDISNSWYRVWFCVWYHPMISVTSDIIAIWYRGFSDIASYIMAPAARRDGAGWGRQTPGAPPAPATPSPTCWGRVFSWTVTALIPRVDLLHWMLRE
jgi:hypothetical protein